MKLDYKSLCVKIWIYFSLFTAALLTLLWLLQIAFLSSFYEGMKIKSIEAIVKEITVIYEKGGYESTVDRLAFKNSILVFITDMDGTVIYTSDEHGPRGNPANQGLGENTRPLPWDYNGFLNRISKSDKNAISYTVQTNNFNGKSLIYGVKLPENAVLYINTPLEPIDSTTGILSTQLIYVTVLSLLSGFIISFFISKKLANPIVKITKSAKKLAEGDFTVKFIKGDYTEIDELSDTLNYTTLELSKTENLRRELMANISHDFRTPLTMIKGYTEMIEEISGDNQEKRKRHLAVIKEETDRLERLVSDILDLSALQAGCFVSSPQSLNLSQIVKNVLNRFAAFSERDGFVIDSVIEEEQYVYADKTRMEQVLYNLIGNAVNYSGENKEIFVRLMEKDGKVRFEVQDNGDGISEEDLPYIWDRYYKSKVQTRSKTGTGIGLSIVKNILLRHQAAFGVSSELGRGSVFWFELEK